jgi:hypothetical protein
MTDQEKAERATEFAHAYIGNFVEHMLRTRSALTLDQFVREASSALDRWGMLGDAEHAAKNGRETVAFVLCSMVGVPESVETADSLLALIQTTAVVTLNKFTELKAEAGR